MRAGSLLFLLLVVTSSSWGAVMEPEPGGGGDNPPDPSCEQINCERSKTNIAVGTSKTECHLMNDETKTQAQNLQGMYDCFSGHIPSSAYTVTTNTIGGIPRSVEIVKSPGAGGGEPDCIGFDEDHPDIGKVSLTLNASGKVAKIFKFNQPPSNSDSWVRVTLTTFNDTTTTYALNTAGHTLAALNSAVRNAIDAGFQILDQGPYWIVVREKGTNSSITHVAVDADDVLLTRLHLELRPSSSMNQYASNCGD